MSTQKGSTDLVRGSEEHVRMIASYHADPILAIANDRGSSLVSRAADIEAYLRDILRQFASSLKTP